MNICPKCGLPLQACVCEEIAKGEQRITVSSVKRRYGKIITVIEGLEDLDIKRIAKDLKGELACGGTVKNNAIELQGDHKKKIKPILVRMGFNEDSIIEN
ncbi:translation initiation factor [Candidatus Pacearchaeota archaeon]|nr:translation initiation factor [Candidatus Pacearchaeota archaeon]